MSENSDSIAAALAGIPDPAGKGNLDETGRIAMSRLKDGVATIVLDATGLSADQRADLERQVRAAMIAVPGVSDTRIAMTAEKQERTIIAIGSGKGGVGKSTVAVNLALALAAQGARAGLLDAETNLCYAVRYLAGAYVTAGGNEDRAVQFYARGYYYDAKRLGLLDASGLR